ncbi:hypothetical protein MVEN_00930200 [Mycena venus]|uniref:Uncharacterized protein n=1 Tax=Mycena venus TaxID=2733690 RepID=A0A8H7D274_9AGAR|nr:hypothetical protein MVEN_00930200 [Mycena venus]
MTLRRLSTAQESLDLYSSADEPLRRLSESSQQDWLADMIFATRAMATGAEFVPVPGVKAALGAVVILLETVDKIKRNREDLKDLCTSTFEIVLILEEEVKINGHTAGVRFAGLLENFISFLRFLQGGLERLLQGRSGLRGRFQEILGATRMTGDIARYRMRLNELRSNFLLVTTINTNLNVSGIQNSVAVLQSIPKNPDFRNVALGDINLLDETALRSKTHSIKVFVARIFGEPSTMTVARYDNEPEVSFRHPRVWQLFGISTAPTLRALIFYDELIPLPVYRQFHRPESDFVWACVEAMLFQQFKDCSQYHRWNTVDNPDGLQATICVKRQPIGICLTIPGLELEWDVDKLERMTSSWHSHSPSLTHQLERDGLKRISTIIASASSPRQLSQHFDWSEFSTALTPVWPAWTSQWMNHEHFFLGSIVGLAPYDCSSSPASVLPVAYIPNDCTVRFKEWTQSWPRKSTAEHLYQPENHPPWQRFAFQPGELKTSGAGNKLFVLSTYIQLNNASRDILDVSWLAQANACIGPAISDERKLYGVIDTLGYVIWFNPAFLNILPVHKDGISREVYLSVPSLIVKYEASRVRIEPPQHDSLYWSLDPAGNSRLSPEECDSLGIPRLQIHSIRGANSWREYHYNAICDFVRAKGFDPRTLDLCQSLGFPLAEMEPLDQSALQFVGAVAQ